MWSRSRPGLRQSRAIWECPDRRPSGPVFSGKSQTWTRTVGFGPVQTGSQSVRDRTSPTLLATSACMSLQAHHVNPHLNNTHKKLETITTCLDTFTMAQPPTNHSYARVATTGAKNTTSPKAHPSLRFELTLTQASHSHPILSELSNDSLLENINEMLMDTGCHFKSRPCTPDCDGSMVCECYASYMCSQPSLQW